MYRVTGEPVLSLRVYGRNTFSVASSVVKVSLNFRCSGKRKILIQTLDNEFNGNLPTGPHQNHKPKNIQELGHVIIICGTFSRFHVFA